MGFHAGASPVFDPHPRPRVPIDSQADGPLDATTWHPRG